MSVQIFDADEHYYEAEDAFTRYASDRMKKEKFVRFVTEADGKRKRLLAGNKVVDVIGNPTFNPIAFPGSLHEMLKSMDAGEERAAVKFTETEPIRREYRDRERRLEVMSEQGVERTLMFPTLGVTMEGFLSDDIDMLYDGIHAFNRWQDDDWGFNHQGRIFCAGYISMLDVDRAITELEYLLKAGCRVITIRPGPAYGRSPADPYFDPFWARVEEAGVLVTYHSFEGPSEVTKGFRQQWAAPPRPYRREDEMLRHQLVSTDAAIMDTLTALILHNLFGRFPKINVASIEMGCSWVPYLMKRLDHGGLGGRSITAFGKPLPGRPSEIFRRHVWVSPFPEEDVKALIGQIGEDKVLMGSDWPHAESNPVPLDYLKCLDGLDEKVVDKVTHENLDQLVPA